MRVLFLHAHFDDYEFTAAGTFELWRRWIPALRARVVVCTDGKAGHHERSRDETGRIREAEQRESARIGRYELEILKYADGTVPREACLQVDIPLLAALWKCIRDFEPDYVFCPPVPRDPLAGIHVDHVAVAEAVRRVAYMINVPHAFLPEYPTEEASRPCKVPVILNVYDGYMAGANAFDLAIRVEETFETISELTWCHQSQICEWLPWVGRHDMETPKDPAHWRALLRRRFEGQARELGLPAEAAWEVFTVTAWGAVPTLSALLRDFPGLDRERSRLEALGRRLKAEG